VIERHITFNVHPDRTAEFERFFSETYRPPMSQSPGYVRVDLLREADSATRYRMVLRWRDADAATTWRESAVHQALQPELAALHSGSEIAVFDVID
jgi:quinol monooxygenase YgiN